jgi:hypothetical protein
MEKEKLWVRLNFLSSTRARGIVSGPMDHRHAFQEGETGKKKQ